MTRTSRTERDEEVDFIIVGSGAASICAALAIKEAGKSPLILEKSNLVGGSTAMSGGVLWMPNNPVAMRAGVKDSYDAALEYLNACTGRTPPTLGSSPERKHAYLKTAPEVVSFLEARGMKFQHAEGYADYHEGELPSGSARGRALVGEAYDVRKLGAWAKKLRAVEGNMPMTTAEAPGLLLYGRTWASKKTLATVGWRMIRNKLFGTKIVGTGAAVQGRLLEIALREQIPIRTDSAVSELIEENGRVVGVIVGEQRRQIRARLGVLLNAGGFSRNLAMRQQWQREPASVDWTNANPGDTGEVMNLAIGLGAAVEVMEQAWWVTISRMPDNPGMHPMHPLDISKPHCIMVDASGERFANESTSYMAIGIATYDRNPKVRTIPAWAILESRHRHQYPWAGQPPGKPPQAWLDSGYMKCADTLEELARLCNIDPAGLRATVDRFNSFAEKGVDEDFQRGQSAYARWMQDPAVRPNGNLGQIIRPPFYAVAIYPGDVGTSGGLVTDAAARVLKTDGTPIEGLYAAGNITSPVVGRSYPGPGVSIGGAAVFGYLAARHAARGPNNRA